MTSKVHEQAQAKLTENKQSHHPSDYHQFYLPAPDRPDVMFKFNFQLVRSGGGGGRRHDFHRHRQH